MKKLALGIIIFTTISACNKKENVDEIQIPNPDSVIISESVPETKGESLPMSQNELSPDQVSSFLKSKSNDTLYVTNFFATWCGPCVREIPHFKEKMEELKNQPVKFTFISLDNKDVWNTKVPEFVDEFGIRDNTILLDGKLIGNQFFDSNFKTWRGETIPFTVMKKGDKSEEINGSISKEELENRLSNFLISSENQNYKEQVPENSKLSEKKIKSSGKKIKLDDDYTVGTINQPVYM